MRRSLDETRVGEYKNNWFFEMIHLLVSLLGVIAIFVLPMVYSTDVASEMTNQINITTNGNNTVFAYVFNGANVTSMQRIVCICALIYWAIILIHSFVTISIPKVNKSGYVKASKIVDIILSLAFLAFLTFYVCVPVTKMPLFDGKHQFYLVSFISLIVCVNLVLINSIFIYFTSKKSSIYD